MFKAFVLAFAFVMISGCSGCEEKKGSDGGANIPADGGSSD